MTIQEFLIQQAQLQLSNTTEAVKDGTWFDNLISALKTEIQATNWNPSEINVALSIVDQLAARKSKIVGLGVHAFTLFIQQIASGKLDDAANTYIQSLGTAELIISAMNKGTLGLIAAKKELDRLHSDAWLLIKDLAISGAKYLLPFLLTLV